MERIGMATSCIEGASSSDGVYVCMMTGSAASMQTDRSELLLSLVCGV